MREMKPSGVEWIGDIPQEWDVVKLKYATDFKQIKYSEQYGELDYIGLENIISWNGMYMETSSHYDREQSLICEENDILFGKLRPYLAKVYLNTKRQCCSSEFCVIKILENHTKYFWYQLISHGFIFMVDRSTYGTKMPRANSDFIRSLYVNIPPLPEQQRIAGFLDRKCAEIDSIITKTKATIEQYKSLKQSVITQAVTKGIRPDRPMKDSGIEWIGEIPQEWSKDKVFRSFSIIGSGTTPKSSDDSNYEGNINWIQSGDINGEVLLSVKKHLSYEAVKEYSALRLYSSPFIVIAMYGASIGNLSISEIDSCVNQACCVLAEPKIRIKYAFYSIKAAKDYLITKAVGGGQPNISQDIVKSLWLPIPPVQEQQEISDYLDSKCAEIDRLIAAKEQLLTELESYKKSVIYEYVTGKKEVLQPNQMITAVVLSYPYFPADINTKKKRFAQAVLMCKVLDVVDGHNGRVKLEKILFILENHIGFDFDTNYVREAAGPLDKSVYQCEGIISSKSTRWYTKKETSKGVFYKPTKNKNDYIKYYKRYFGNYDSEITRIITALKDLTTGQAEIMATLYGAWNDFIIQHRAFIYEDIVDEVWNNWNESKRRISKDNWLKGIYQLIELNLVPKGYGKMTKIKGSD